MNETEKLKTICDQSELVSENPAHRVQVIQAMIIADTVEFTGSTVVDIDNVTTTNPLLAQATLLE